MALQCACWRTRDRVGSSDTIDKLVLASGRRNARKDVRARLGVTEKLGALERARGCASYRVGACRRDEYVPTEKRGSNTRT